MKTFKILSFALALAAAGCSRVEPPPEPAAAAPTPSVAPSSPARAVLVAHQSDEPPTCDHERAQDLVKEAFIRRALVEGDDELIKRGALDEADAFAEEEIARAMPQMVAMAAVRDARELAYDVANKRRRCVGRLAVREWDLQPTVTYEIAHLSDASRFGVESRVHILSGAEGFNMLLGYRSTFGRAIRT